MDYSTLIVLIVTGLVAGLLGGSLGVGGAIIVIPALVILMGMSQQEAQGTSLAFMIPPIGILAAMNYYKHGYVNWKYAMVLSVTFMLGAYVGSKFAMNIPAKILKRVFGIVLLYVSYKMIFAK
ncbi:MAG: sulfite exporter TauE/SafE family protein [Prolixibacteraceae bacterium]